VTDDIRTLTQRLADEPASLAFLDLGEALRRRGQVEAAYKVARGGLNRYPGLADAHDLMARILSDQGDLAGAFDAWADALRFDPMRTGALKGIAFLYFRAGNVEAALDHLQRATEADPDDPDVARAIARVRSGVRPERRAEIAQQAADSPAAPVAPAPPAPADSPFAGVDPDQDGLLLIDATGLCLAGRLAGPDGGPGGERAAALLAGVGREAARATRLLGLGGWHSIAVETPEAHLLLSAPTTETVLLAVRQRSLPMARVALLAERAGRAARAWLERVG
jgi:tetratricopeptide (TPR) repeat protein